MERSMAVDFFHLCRDYAEDARRLSRILSALRVSSGAITTFFLSLIVLVYLIGLSNGWGVHEA